MFKPLELYIGLRYTRAKRRNHFISFISLISMVGIALGVTALITVLSVMNGFEKEMRDRILGMTAHATVTHFRSRLNNWPDVAKAVEKDPHVLASAPYIRAEAMLSRGGMVSGTILRGVLPEEEARVSRVSGSMKLGQLDDLKPGRFGIVLGRELAYSLGVGLNDKVTVVTPQANVTPVGIMPRLRRFTVVGLFEVGMYEYDRGMALIHLSDAAKLFRMEEAVTGVRLKLDDMFRAPFIIQDLAQKLPGSYLLSDWTQQHANFFRALRTEKRVMFIIILLIVAVAAFNIVSTLVMVVTDKQADIAILRTLGSTPLSIMTIFMIQGTIIGLIGTLMGLAGGISLAMNVETIVPVIEQTFGIQFLPADVYYISDLPSDLQSNDIIRVGAMSFVLSLLATIYPAWRASRTLPAEALRYE